MTRPDGPARIIFIAGSSFSGSTLISLILGAQPEAVFGGELKDYKRRMQSEIRGSGTFCSCGASRERCEFWGKVQERYGREVELSPAPGFSASNFVMAVKLLTGLGLAKPSVTSHGSLVKSAYEVARSRDPSVEYLIDSSKSIYNLDEICRMPGVDVFVIHLIRNGTSVAQSYHKRGTGALYGLITWVVGNAFMRLYFRRRRLKWITVDYRSLCTGDEATYQSLNDFLGMNVSLHDAADRIRHTHFHIVSGNGKVRRSAADFKGIRYSETPLEAGPVVRRLARWIVRPMNKVFGATADS
jgi:hypothetical protein